jgi:hypothetical protein
MVHGRDQRLIRDLVPGDLLDIAPYCGPGLVCQGVRVTALPHPSGQTTQVRVAGKPVTRELWKVPAVCATCGEPFFKLELPDAPVRLQHEAAPRG